MRVRATAAVAAMLMAALTACGGGGSDSLAGGPTKAAASKPATKDGTESASPRNGTGADGDGKGRTMAWGKTAWTTGYQDPDSGGGNLNVTPTTIIYQAKAMGSESRNGVFAIVIVKDAAADDSAATENAAAAGGGWQWIAPDGQTLSGDEGEAASVNPEGFNGDPNVQPGA